MQLIQRECTRVSAKTIDNKIDRMELGRRRGTSTDWRTVFRISGSMLEKMGYDAITAEIRL